MENLDDRIVDKANLPKTDDYLKEEDLPGIAITAKSKELELDEFFDLAEAGIFTALTPYKEGTSLVSNGNTYRYDRKQDKLRRAEETFADCAEKGAAHIMNILHYDHINRDYDLKPIEEFIKQKEQESGIKNPYFQHYQDFYKTHSPASANAGDTASRSEWNRVVGDLNAFDDALHIDYMKDSNELNAGFINFVRVFQKIFGLTLDALPTTGLQAQKDWLEKSLKTLFTTVNPNKSYQLNLSGVTEKDNDLSGNVGVVVGDKATQTALFSFTFRSVPNVHSDVADLKTLKEVKKNDYRTTLGITGLNSKTTEQVLWMLAPADLKDWRLSHPLYQLFNTPLVDNNSKIDFLRTTYSNFSNWRKKFLFTEDKLQSFKAMLENVLNDISWEDNAVFQEANRNFKNLSKFSELHDALFRNVMVRLPRAFRGDEKSRIAFIENLTTDFAEWRKTFLSTEDRLQTFKKIFHDMLQENTNDVVLKEDVLEKRSLIFMKFLQQKELEIFCDEIQLLNLPFYGDYDTFLNLSAFKNLKHLSLMAMRGSEIEITGLNKLKKLNLLGARIKNIRGLNTLTELEELNLFNTPYLEEIDIKNLNQLKILNLSSSGITTFKGFSTLTGLKELDLSDAVEIAALEFTEDRKDLKINLSGSGIKNKTQIRGIEHLDEKNISW